jgi:hypothetical protein
VKRRLIVLFEWLVRPELDEEKIEVVFGDSDLGILRKDDRQNIMETAEL